MASVALAGTVEIHPSGFQIAGENVRRMLGIAILCGRLDLVLEEMRDIGHLGFGEIGLVIRQLLQSRSDLVAQPIAQNQWRTDQVGALFGAFRSCSVAVDAELRVDLSAARGGGVIDLLTLIGAGLSP